MALMNYETTERIWKHVLANLSEKVDRDELNYVKNKLEAKIANAVNEEDIKNIIEAEISTIIPQSDWNQNDETAKDYIKNKPFYEMRAHDDIRILYDDFMDESYNTGMNMYTYKMPGDYSGWTVQDFIGATINKSGNMSNDIILTEDNITEDGHCIVARTMDYGESSMYNRYVVFVEPGYTYTDGSYEFTEGLWGFSNDIISEEDDTMVFSMTFPVTLKTIDTKYLPDVVSDWNQNDETALNYIKNKPFGFSYYEEILKWDGDITNITETEYCDMFMRYCGPFLQGYYESADWFTGNTVEIKSIFAPNDLPFIPDTDYKEVLIDSDAVKYVGNSSSCIFYRAWPAIVVVSEEDAGSELSLPYSDGTTTNKATFPSAGVWIMKTSLEPAIRLMYYGEIKTIDKKFLPGTAVSIEVDPTLTVEGQAADAKAVGDRTAVMEISEIDLICGGIVYDESEVLF